MQKVIFIINHGSEELETIAPLDILLRAGAECVVASAAPDGELLIKGRNGIHLNADAPVTNHLGTEFDCVVVPGGPGHADLRKDKVILDFLSRHAATGKLVAAICAAPTVLLDAGLLENRKHTSHFSVKGDLPNRDTTARVVVDGNIITSQGAGTAVAFGLEIVRQLYDEAKAEEISKSICC